MKAKIGVCYYPEQWDESLWFEDAKRMRETGISWVRIGEFSWSRLEATEGKFTWEWLDRAIETLGNAGLQVVLGTPSATPPKWVVDKYPDMLAIDRTGQVRGFGSRRHYCFSHLGYRAEAARIACQMAKRYGSNSYVQAWQIDNEYGCHDTILSFSSSAIVGFRKWLAEKYKTVEALNSAWGNVFWSMEYTSFEQVELPNLTVTEANPSHWLDFYRYSSDQVVDFNQAQIDAMQEYCNAPFIHNYMGRVTDFDHFAVSENLQISSWDSYPLGFLERVLAEEDENWKQRFYRQGDPDFQAFHHDLYRAVGKGRWWVMEQQPGPVNWAPYNPIPLDGMVKLWGMEAVAHGAEVVSYFRWRQALFAQEQMHAGLLRPDNENAQGQKEVSELAQDIDVLGDLTTKTASIAIVFDYESQWAWEIQPQGQGFDYFRLVFEQYRALRRLGLNIDILSSTSSDWSNYDLVVIPGLLSWNSKIQRALANFDGVVLAGPRTGRKTTNMQIPKKLDSDFAGVTVSAVASLRPNVCLPIAGGGSVIHWFENLETQNPIEQTKDGQIVAARQGQHIYLGSWLDSEGYDRMFSAICSEIGLKTKTMPEGVRQRQLGDKILITNYNAHAVEFEGIILPAAGYVWI